MWLNLKYCLLSCDYQLIKSRVQCDVDILKINAKVRKTQHQTYHCQYVFSVFIGCSHVLYHCKSVSHILESKFLCHLLRTFNRPFVWLQYNFEYQYFYHIVENITSISQREGFLLEREFGGYTCGGGGGGRYLQVYIPNRSISGQHHVSNVP